MHEKTRGSAPKVGPNFFEGRPRRRKDVWLTGFLELGTKYGSEVSEWGREE